MSMTLPLSTLCVICLVATSSGWLYSLTTCQQALNSYCVKDPDVVCTNCAKNIGDEATCERSTDPLLCHMKNQHACNESSGNKLCDTTLGLQYGCYGDICWSQCVDEEYGDDEWCYLGKRQLGPRVEYECTEAADCKPSDLDSVMCSSSCGKTGTLKK